MTNTNVVQSIDEAQKLNLSYPVEVRPEFTFNGHGFGIAYDRLALIGLVEVGLDASPTGRVQIKSGGIPNEPYAGLLSVSFNVASLPKVSLVMTFDSMVCAQAARDALPLPRSSKKSSDGPYRAFLEMPKGYTGPIKISNPGALAAEVTIVRGADALFCKCGHSFGQHSKGIVTALYCQHCPCPEWRPEKWNPSHE